MASLTLKSIPDDLLQVLRESARRERRSLNSEVLYRLERSTDLCSIDEPPLDVRSFLRDVEELNRELKLSPMTDERLERAKNQGRP